MIPRLLSIVMPLFAYVTLALLLAGLWRQRKKWDWLSLAPAFAGLLTSIALLAPVHRLFFDEDIYISMAANLTHAPLARITLFGGPDDVRVSSYYKEPPAWPVLLSLVFLITGRSETVAFIVARILFAACIAVVFHFAREVVEKRWQAFAAALLFAAAPACFWFSVSAGIDIPAALFATLGMYGLLAGNGILAAAGLALAAQTRLELIVLMPLIWLARGIERKWKLIAMALVAAEIVHLGWVFSVAPALAEVEKVPSAFSLRYLPGNIAANLAYILNPLVFPAGITILAFCSVILYARRRLERSGFAKHVLLALQAFCLMCVYVLFYAGNFDLNPRYTIQILPPLAVLAVSICNRAVLAAALAGSLAVPYVRAYEFPPYVQALAADHRISVEFAPHIKRSDLVVSTEPEVFLNLDKEAMNATYASEHQDVLEAELRRGVRVIYHAGIRTNRNGTPEWKADQWVKANFDLHVIDSHEISSMRTAFYDLSLKLIDGETRIRGAFK